MTVFKRDNLNSKTNYYTIFIIVELLIIASLFYFGVHWLLLVFIIPILLVDIISNKRCLNRQKNFIANISFENGKLICKHLKNEETIIPFEKAKFSIRERKFEKDKTEIEIKLKKSLKSKLIGRLHINNWSDIFKIKDEFIKNNIIQVKYKPEGYWSKYGGYTADVIIITSSLALGEIADFSGDTEIASDARELGFNTDFSSIHDDKDEKPVDNNM